METIGSSEARTHLARLLGRVAEGEEFTITRRGRPVARLVPAAGASPGPDVRAAVEAMRAFRRGRTLGDLSIR